MTTIYEAKSDPARPLRPASPMRPKPVSVNGVSISRAAIAREVQNHPASKPAEAWLKAARALAIRELLLQEATRLGLTAEPLTDDNGRPETQEEAVIRALVEREISVPKADEATCRRFFEKNRQRFRSEDLFAVRHILCAAAPADVPGRTAAKRLAEMIIKELLCDPTRFASLAAAHSACPSRNAGGNLGQISRGQTVPEFESALASLPVGQVATTPIETRYGIHVVAVDQRIDGAPLPFDLVHAHIVDWLEEHARHTAIRQYIGLLAGRSDIKGLDLEDQSAALVQ